MNKETVMCRGQRFRLYLSEEQIQQRIQELGAQITNDYEGKKPILIGVLNGAFMFLADLIRAIDLDSEIDFIKLSSYGDAKVSSGRVHELKSIDAQIEGRHVIVVEDIVDTGLSMEFMMQRMNEYKPASVEVAVLLHKYEATQVDLDLKYVAFPVPNLFVIGYGLDYGQLARNLSQIYVLDE
ncbi:MAG: hypoxanthine phosphoribosyltransferase [Rhodothermaceae bacterium]|nr:hypoxanthine phosphoribosyltransferase [Rhodothermaceae bacterium]